MQSVIRVSYGAYKTLCTLNKVQKILPTFRKSENTAQSFIMVVDESFKKKKF